MLNLLRLRHSELFYEKKYQNVCQKWVIWLFVKSGVFCHGLGYKNSGSSVYSPVTQSDQMFTTLTFIESGVKLAFLVIFWLSYQMFLRKIIHCVVLMYLVAIYMSLMCVCYLFKYAAERKTVPTSTSVHVSPTKVMVLQETLLGKTLGEDSIS